MTRRHGVLAVLLLATLGAAFWPGQEALDEADPMDAGAVVEAMPRGRPAPVSQPAGTTQAAEALAGAPAATTRLAPGLTADLFPAQSFRPPPRPLPPAPVLPPPPPMAPPLPYTFVGAWHEDARPTVFLEQGNLLLSAHVGDTLPGGWRLDRFEPDGLGFTYLALNQQRTLRIAP